MSSVLLKETKSIFKMEGVDVVNTAAPRESIQCPGSQLPHFTEVVRKDTRPTGQGAEEENG